jgi:hypothetical protein
MSGIERKSKTIWISDGDDFLKFLNNSSIKYLSAGANGVTFVATVTDVSNSPYISTDVKTYGNPVTKVLVKLLFLKEDSDEEDKSVLYYAKDKKNKKDEDKSLTVAKEGDFIVEVNTQLCIYEKTKEYLEPICPAIVLSSIIKNGDKIKNFLELLATKGEDSRPMLRIMKEQYPDRFSSLGVICMEFADGYDTMHNLQNKAKFFYYKAMCMYLLLELAMKTCFTHGDFHYGNIMFNTTADGYFSGGSEMTGKPMLIDFGYTRPIDAARCDSIKQHVTNRNYLLALQTMCQENRKDDLQINMYPDFYGWTCGAYPFLTPKESNRIFYNIFDRLKAAHMAELKSQNPGKQFEEEEIKQIDDEIQKQAATELSRAPIDMTNPKMIELNALIGILFDKREEAKMLSKERIKDKVSLPLPLVTECTQVGMEELDIDIDIDIDI